jgi:hypothetical protein
MAINVAADAIKPHVDKLPPLITSVMYKGKKTESSPNDIL